MFTVCNSTSNNNQQAVDINRFALTPRAGDYAPAPVQEQRKGDERMNMHSAAMSPRVLACQGPYAGDLPEEKEQYNRVPHIVRRANSQVSLENFEMLGSPFEGSASPSTTRSTPKIGQETRRELMPLEEAYNSPRNAKAKQQEAKETMTPYGQHDNYIRHAQDKATCYDAAILNSTSKHTLFYKDANKQGDLRPKPHNPLAETNTRCTDRHWTVNDPQTPMTRVLDNTDRWEEDYFHHQPKPTRVSVGSDYDLKRNRNGTISNTVFPETAYMKMRSKAKQQELKKFGHHKAGHELEGHDTDSEGEEASWARGKSMYRQHRH